MLVTALSMVPGFLFLAADESYCMNAGFSCPLLVILNHKYNLAWRGLFYTIFGKTYTRRQIGCLAFEECRKPEARCQKPVTRMTFMTGYLRAFKNLNFRMTVSVFISFDPKKIVESKIISQHMDNIGFLSILHYTCARSCKADYQTIYGYRKY